MGTINVMEHVDVNEMVDDQPMPTTPSAWFASIYPKHASQYGTPILEGNRMDEYGFATIVPRAPNIDFMASTLDANDDQGTVYIPRHLSFYTCNPETQIYSPIATENLMLQLSQQFLKCAHAMGGNVDVEPLFTKCRSVTVLKQIIQRARIVLKVDDSFLDEKGRKVNESSLSPVQRADIFAAQYLKPDSEAVLALKDCYAAYGRFCETNVWRTPPVRDFTKAINIAVQEKYRISLRHDMKSISQMSGWGWLGLQIDPSGAP